MIRHSEWILLVSNSYSLDDSCNKESYADQPKNTIMKRKYLFILILTFVVSLNFAQEAIMVEYDFITKDSTIINFGESTLNQDNASTLSFIGNAGNVIPLGTLEPNSSFCLLYTSDAADE